MSKKVVSAFDLDLWSLKGFVDSSIYPKSLVLGIQLATQQLQNFANSPTFSSQIKSVLGQNVETTKLQQDWKQGNFSQFPQLKLLSFAELKGAKGAFTESANTIYLSQEFLARNTDNPVEIASVLLEEIGHALDVRVNQGDTDGDEGELFSSLVRGISLEPQQLQDIKQENDRFQATIDGQTLNLEAAGILSETTVREIRNRLDGILAGLQENLSSQLLKNTLINSVFGDRLESTENLRLLDTVRLQLNKINITSSGYLAQDLVTEINRVLAGTGANISYNATTDQFALSFAKAQTTDFALDSQLGIPNVGLNFLGKVGLTANFNSTINFSVGSGSFVFQPIAGKEFSFNLIAENSTNLSGSLGFLNLKASNNGTQKAFSTKFDLSADILAGGQIQGISTTDSLSINSLLNLDSGQYIPTFKTTLAYNLTSSQSNPTLKFTDVKIGLGSLMQSATPFLKDVKGVVDKFDPIINFLNKPLPVIDKFGINYSILDLAQNPLFKTYATQVLKLPPIDLSFLDSISKLNTLLGTLSKLSSSGDIILGSFDVTNTGNIFNPKTNTNVAANAGKLIGDTSFTLPILNDPNTAFQLLLGNPNVDLFRFTLPGLSVNTGGTLIFPIWPLPPVSVGFGGSIGATIPKTTYGFDATGLLKYRNSNNFENIFEGLYLDSKGKRPGLELNSKLFMDINAGIRGIASVGGEAYIKGLINLALNDPNKDGKIRWLEIKNNFNQGFSSLFDVSGGVSAGANIYVEYPSYNPKDYFSGKVFKRENILELGPIPIPGLQFESSSSRTVLPPSLGVLKGKVLRLNIGIYAAARTNNKQDVSEIYTITGGSTITLTGPTQGQDKETFSGVTSVEGDGNLGDDRLNASGLTVAVKFTGGVGRDVLTGGNQNDILKGGEDSDTLTGNAGNDSLSGDAGSDSLLGGAGADTLLGGEGNDTLLGELGNDSLSGSIGSDRLQGGGDNDTLDGGLDNDTLIGEDGNDSLYGSYGDDLLQGGNQNDTLKGGYGNDTLEGGEQDDSLIGEQGNDWLKGAGGNDTLQGSEGNDTLEGGLNNDSLLGGFGNDSLLGAEGLNTLQGNDGNDTLLGGQDNDTILGDAGQDSLEGNRGNDSLSGGSDNDIIFGRDGDDILKGDEGNDYLWGNQGKDILLGGVGDDTLEGGEDNDSLDGESGLNTLLGGAGNDTLVGGDSNDSLSGGTEDDSLQGNSGNDTLLGAQGNDTLYGGVGNDLLDSGEDNDYLEDVTGSNTLLGGAAKDTLMGGDEIDLLLGGAGDDELKGLVGNDTLYGGYDVDTLDGGAGDDILYGGAGNDSVIGGIDNDTIYGDQEGNDILLGVLLGGDDILKGGVGNDKLYGDELQDKLYGEDGNDWLDGGADNDILEGGLGDNTLYGGIGADLLTGGDNNDTLIGGDGNDTLIGGKGNDSLVGETGEDSLQGGNDNDILEGNQGNDTLEGGLGDDSLVGGEGDDLLKGHLIELKTEVVNKDGNDTLNGEAGNDEIWGSDGSDSLIGGDGNDILYGDDSDNPLLDTSSAASPIDKRGDDTLEAGAGNDTLYGGLGNDILKAGTGFDRLYGGTGNDTLYGYEPTLVSDNGNPQIITNNGKEYYVSSDRQPQDGVVYVLAPGSGTDTIYNFFSGTKNGKEIVYQNPDGTPVTNKDGKVLTLGSDVIRLTGGLSFSFIDIVEDTKPDGKVFTKIIDLDTQQVLAEFIGITKDQIGRQNIDEENVPVDHLEFSSKKPIYAKEETVSLVDAQVRDPNGASDIEKIDFWLKNPDGTWKDFRDIGLTGVKYGNADWGDFDKDGDLDILVTGYTSKVTSEGQTDQVFDLVPVTKLYRYDKPSKQFVEILDLSNVQSAFDVIDKLTPPLAQLSQGTVMWGNFDGDSDGNLDILQTGKSDTGITVAKIYINQGQSFQAPLEIKLSSSASQEVNWLDINKDGKLDLQIGTDIYLQNNGGLVKNNISLDVLQTHEFSFVRQFGTDNEDTSKQMSIDSRGYIYIPLNTYSFSPTFSQRASLEKYAINGNFISSKQFAALQNVDAVAVDSQDNIFVIGKTGDPYFLVKYDPNVQFTDSWDLSTYFSNVSDIQIDKQGNIYIVGSNNDSENRLVKFSFDSKGIINAWTQPINFDITYANTGDIALDEQGNIYLTGYNYFSKNTVVAKYNTANGQVKWTQEFGFSSSELFESDIATDVAVDNQSNVYITGFSNNDAFLVKYDSTGNYLWGKTLGYSDSYIYTYSYGHPNINLTVDNLDSIYVAGAKNSEQPNNFRNIFLDKYDANNGNRLWSEQLSSDDNSTPSGILLDYSGNIYINGETRGKISNVSYVDSSNFLAKLELASQIYSNQWTSFDGKTYLLMTAKNSQGQPITQVYQYTSDNQLQLLNVALLGISEGKAIWGDYDKDTKTDDILLSGKDQNGNLVTKIYKFNNTTNTFIEVPVLLAKDTNKNGKLDTDEQSNLTSISGIYQGDISWQDFDKDGKLDILLTGFTVQNRRTADGKNVPIPVTKIYQLMDDTNGIYFDANINLSGVANSSVQAKDFDGDGNLDLLITGEDIFVRPEDEANLSSSQLEGGNPTTTIYHNDSSDGKIKFTNPIFTTNEKDKRWANFNYQFLSINLPKGVYELKGIASDHATGGIELVPGYAEKISPETTTLQGTAAQNIFVIGNKNENFYTSEVKIEGFNPNLDTLQLYGIQDDYTYNKDGDYSPRQDGNDTLIKVDPESLLYDKYKNLKIRIEGVKVTDIQLSDNFTQGNIIFADPKRDDSESVKFVITDKGDPNSNTLDFSSGFPVQQNQLQEPLPGQFSTFGALAGGDGNDTLKGSQTNSEKTLDGGVLVTYLDGGTGDDSIIGSNLNIDSIGQPVTDILLGWEGNDTLLGLQGRNILDGGSDNDLLVGGSNSDTLEGGQGNDTLNSGTGVDTATYRNAPKGVTVNLASTTATQDGYDTQDTFITAGTVSTIESVIGSNYADSLTGDAQNNLLSGLAGNDTIAGGMGNNSLEGGTGNDSLLGGVGFDTLISGGGADTLEGGAGVDTYIVRSPLMTLEEAFTTLGGNYKTRGDVTINGQKITWETFRLWADPSRWNGRVQWDKYRAIGLEPDEQLYKQAQTNNKQGWLRQSLSGTVIRDENSGEDTLIIAANAPLSKTGLAVGKVGFYQSGNDLILDLNKDGVSNTKDDLTIKDFFNGNQGGAGSISTIRIAGLEASYYKDANFSDLVATKIDPNINFDWGHKAPLILGDRTDDFDFGVIWQGFLKADTTGTYKFQLKLDSNDRNPKTRLFVNNILVKNESQGVNLSANQEYSFRLEYAEQTGEAKVQLLWSVNNSDFQIIPEEQFLSPQTFSAADILNTNSGLTPILQENLGIQTTKDWKSSATWGDYNNDGNLDFLVVGSDAYGNGIARIYRNTGTFNSTSSAFAAPIQLTQFERFNTAVWGDYNNDGYLDILATGINTILNGGQPEKKYQVKVLLNQSGLGFKELTINKLSTENLDTPSQVNWADFDNDGKLDIVTTNNNRVNLYLGNGISPSPFNTKVNNGVINLGDINNDGYIDIVLSGKDDGQKIWKPKESQSLTTESPKSPDRDTFYQDFELSHIDNLKPNKLYEISLSADNFDTYLQIVDDKGNVFAYDDDSGEGSNSLLSFNYVVEKFKDYKIRVTTYSPNITGDFQLSVREISSTVEIWQNSHDFKTPSKSFEQLNPEKLSLYGAETAALGDYDADGKLDILITDKDRTRVYQNKGNNASIPFSEFNGKSFTGELRVTSTGKLIKDLVNPLRTGSYYKPYLITDLINDSDKAQVVELNLTSTFDTYLQIVKPGTGTTLPQLIAFDDDSGGGTNSLVRFNYTPDLKDAEVWVTTYKGDVTGSYTLSVGDIGLPSSVNSAAAWADYDNDGDLDVALNGLGDQGSFTKVFLNPVIGTSTSQTFSEQPALLPGLQNGSASWGDYDSDGDLDLLLTGTLGTTAQPFVQIYRNNTYDQGNGTANLPPSTPTLTTSPQITIPSGIQLSWNDVSLGEEPYTYNLHIGTSSGGTNVLSPLANSQGKRTVAQIGNAGYTTNKILTNLAKGVTHYWSVQSIDNGFLGSTFSPESSFTTNPFSIVPTGVTITPLTALVTDESGTQAKLRVVLNSRPTANVTIEIGTSDATEGKFTDEYDPDYTTPVYTLTFTPENWNIAQTFAVQGIDDTFDDGNVRYIIETTVTSADATYNGISVNELTLVNQDNDNPITRVSLAGDGNASNANSNSPSITPSISANGLYVTFESNASNLVPNDNNGLEDIFVYDRTTGQITRINIANDGIEANDTSYSPKISADGLYVTFESNASNLVPNDNNGLEDIFVYDRTTGQITRINIANDGIEANDTSYSPKISADGLYVTFASNASNLIPNDNNGLEDIFVYDRTTGQITRVSIANDGTEGNGYSYSSSISADGLYVTFASNASNLVPNDNNQKTDIFIYDRTTGQITRVSIANDGTEGNSYSYSPSISGDGRYIAFYSNASNLVPNDNNEKEDIFVYDQTTGQITRVSVDSNGAEANGKSYSPSISGDGRYIAFYSNASNLVPNDNNGKFDTFVYDLIAGQITRVSVDSNGVEANGESFLPSLSGDGRYIAFESNASNLVPNDNNGLEDIFVYDRTATTGVTITPNENLVTTESGGTASFSVVLKSKPTADVIIPISSSHITEGKIAVSQLTFTPENWNVAQTVTITGVDDSLSDRDIIYSIITEPIKSGDSNYNNLNPDDISVTNVDNESIRDGIWGDYNKDGKLDVLSITSSTSRIYQNQNGKWIATSTTLPGATQGSWADYDKDSNLDFLLLSGTQTYIYRNQAGSFTAVNTTLPGATQGAWADYNNDGDLDLLLVGDTQTNVYRNQAGSFTAVNTTLPGATQGSWADYDNDGDLDLLLVGDTQTNVYRNQAGSFTAVNTTLPGATQGSWADYDNDGDLDLLLINATQTHLYKNNLGSLTIDTTLSGGSSLVTGDYDHDGLLDIAIVGDQVKIYKGSATGFKEYIDQIPLSSTYNTITQADYDNDRDLDLFLSNGTGVAQVFRNDAAKLNTAPTAPNQFQTVVSKTGVTLKWSGATDAQTPTPGLSYNLRLGTAPGTSNIFAAPINNGNLLLPQSGNVGQGAKETDGSMSWALTGLAPGQYYWSIQTVDNSLLTSKFSVEQSFNILPPPPVLPTLSFSSPKLIIAEGDSGQKSVLLTVQLSQASQQEVRVEYSVYKSETDTSTPNEDFQPITGTLVFNPNQTSQTIELIIQGDTTPETAETFTVSLQNPINAQLVTNQNQAKITITSESSDGVILVPDLQVTQLSAPNSAQQTQSFDIAWTVQNIGTGGSAETRYASYVYLSQDTVLSDEDDLLGVNWQSLPETGKTQSLNQLITIPYNVTKTQYLIVSSNPAQDPQEANAFNNTISRPITITAAQLPNLTLQSVTAPNQGTAGSKISVTSSVKNIGVGTAKSGWTTLAYLSADKILDASDILLEQQTVTTPLLAMGATSNLTTEVTLANTGLTQEYLLFTVVPASDDYDSDTKEAATAKPIALQFTAQPQISLNASAVLVTEDGNDKLIYTFTRTGDITNSLTVNFSVGGTAQFNTDYTQTGAASYSATTGSITFAAGSATAILSLTPVKDTVGELDETVRLTLSSGTGYTLETNVAIATTIKNDDIPLNNNFANAITLSGKNINLTGSNRKATRETGESLILNDTVGNSVWYFWTAPTTGTVELSTNGSQFDTLLGVFTGNFVSELTLVTSDDDSGEGENSFVTFNATAGVRYAIAIDGVGDDVGDFVLKQPSLSIADLTTIERDSTSQAVVTVTLDPASAQTTTVNYATANGTAIAGQDYTTVSGTLTFLAGETVKTFTIPILTDAVKENDETFTVKLSTPSKNAKIAQDTTTVTIKDTVKSSTSLTLAATDNNLQLTGTSNINGTGNAGNNILLGNIGNNTLDGSSGNDTLNGGAGNDTLISSTGNDSVIGGDGIDTLKETKDVNFSLTDIQLASFTLTNNIITFLESDTLNSIEKAELMGGDGNNILDASGFTGNVFLSGSKGYDQLIGTAKNDTLDGGDGNDTLTGGLDNDILTGGSGNDQFIYDTNTAFTTGAIGIDIIQDFTSGVDKITIDKTTFTAINSNAGIGFGILNEFAVVSSDLAAATSNAYIVFNSTNSKLFYNQNGGTDGLGTGNQLVTLSGVSNIQATDFIIQA